MEYWATKNKPFPAFPETPSTKTLCDFALRIPQSALSFSRSSAGLHTDAADMMTEMEGF
jgi:hypothetical protein